MQLLTSRLPLPVDCTVAYSVLTGEHDAVDILRRSLLGDGSIMETTLTSVRIRASEATIYVFRINGTLENLDTELTQASHGTSSISDALQPHFSNAIVSHILHNLSSVSSRVQRLGLAGFVLYDEEAEGEWYCTSRPTRPLLFCRLHARISATNILIRPSFHLSSFVPLPVNPSPGTPIVLLPFRTPAQYLGLYSAPSALTSQFNSHLTGLGVFLPSPTKYILAQIGMPIVYPASLALCTLPQTFRENDLYNPFPQTVLQVSVEVSQYVDTVAREREKERERMRKERETATNPTQLIPSVYPSPPHTVGPSTALTLLSPVVVPSPSPPISNPFAPTNPTSFDDPTWMDVDFLGDLGMDIDFQQDEQADSGGGGFNTNAGGSAFGFDADFTDDDFSFFDRPDDLFPAPIVPLPPTPAFAPTPLDSSSPLFIPPSASPFTYPSPYVPTPQVIIPATPVVYLETNGKSVDGKGFDPIPFSAHHRLSDDKYASGKFSSEEYGVSSLPSPPPEPDWRERYKVVTNPSVGLVRMLKRKHRHRNLPHSSSSPGRWDIDCISEEIDNLSLNSSDSSSDSEGGEEDEIDNYMEVDNPSRSQSPYFVLPPGPALLASQFQYIPPSLPTLSIHIPTYSHSNSPSHLQSGVFPPSTVYPPSAASSHHSANLHPPPYTAPTPVSPGQQTSLEPEDAARVLAREVVDGVWGSSSTSMDDIVQDRWRPLEIAALFQQALGSGISSLEEVFGEVEVLDPPKFVLSKPTHSPSLAVPDITLTTPSLEILPSSLRFWDKLGLGPRGRGKKMRLMALYPRSAGCDPEIMDMWLTGIMADYNGKRLGEMVLGMALAIDPKCFRNDITNGETFEDTLKNFLRPVPPRDEIRSVLLFVPPAIASFASPGLRCILAAVQHILNTTSPPVVISFVPTSMLMTAFQLPLILYTRTLVPVENNANVKWLQEPAFTLAKIPRKVKYGKKKVLDVMERGMMLHVGYAIFEHWLVAYCIDEEGQAWDVGVWLLEEEEEEGIVKHIWEFVNVFSRQASVDWRVVVAKMGGDMEVDAWRDIISKSNVSISLIHVDDTGWVVLPTPAKEVTGGTHIIDTTSISHAIYPSDTSSVLIKEKKILEMKVRYSSDNCDIRDTTRSFHALRVLGNARGFVGHLPIHLAAVRRVGGVLASDEVVGANDVV